MKTTAECWGKVIIMECENAEEAIIEAESWARELGRSQVTVTVGEETYMRQIRSSKHEQGNG
jgi:hypothetical protein